MSNKNKNAKFVVLVYGIADRDIHSIHIHDNDVGLDKVKPGRGEALVRVPMSRYVQFSSDRLKDLIP